jgi:lipid A ethanolaminephosphotransferase
MPPALCDGERCFDEAMVKTLEKTVAATPGNLLVVMHQMGNHGPAYYKRYPDAFKHYTPACEDSDLAHCAQETIVNAYDNAIRYTDHVLASTVRYLRDEKTHDTAMIYVSDHGESLGENGLYLHGLPYAIAPEVQTKVPMVMWLSPGYASSFTLSNSCIAERAKSPVEHDHLFHTMLGMLDVNTSVYETEMDFSAACRRQ